MRKTSYLHYSVRDDRERAISCEIGNAKYVDSPSVDVRHALNKTTFYNIYSAAAAFTAVTKQKCGSKSQLHRVLKKSKLFLSHLCQISTNFDNLCHTDGQDDKIT